MIDKLKQERKENFEKVVYHEKAEWMPLLSMNSMASLSYVQKTYWEVEQSPEEFSKAMSKIYEVLPADIASSDAIALNGHAEEILRGNTQTKITADGYGFQHIQNAVMKEDEYAEIMKDISGFVKHTLLPRRMPFLFELDPKEAAKLVIACDKSQRHNNVLNATTVKYVEENYGVNHIKSKKFMVNTPGDYIFDQFRGFKGTMVDLRRHYEEMKELAQALWDNGFMPKYDGKKLDVDGRAGYMAHIPSFLSPKQYEELCFQYFKQEIVGLSQGGGQLYMLAEGTWSHIMDYMLDLPDNSMIMVLENDDVIETYKKIGSHQAIAGGVKMCDIRLNTKETCINKAKEIIDACAGPTSGFVFSTDKSWVCKGDINQNLIDVYNFAHEYGKY